MDEKLVSATIILLFIFFCGVLAIKSIYTDIIKIKHPLKWIFSTAKYLCYLILGLYALVATSFIAVRYMGLKETNLLDIFPIIIYHTYAILLINGSVGIISLIISIITIIRSKSPD